MQVEAVQLDKIQIPTRIRSLNPELVAALRANMKEAGLLSPITVNARDDGAMVLAAGAHRLQAAKELGWKEITAVITTVSEIDRQLIEIDENLCRSDLSPAERALHMTRRKKLWLAKHSASQEQAKLGIAASAAAQGSSELGGQTVPTQFSDNQTGRAEPTDDCDSKGRHKSPQQMVGFAGATAITTGKSKRAVNMTIRRAEKLGDTTLHVVARTSLDKCVELDAMARLTPEERTELATRAKAGENVSAKKVMEAQSKSPAVQNQNLAKRAVAVLEKCSAVMDEHEFRAALKGVSVPENVASLAVIIASCIGGESGPGGAG